MPSPERGVGHFEHQTVMGVLHVRHHRVDSVKRSSELACFFIVEVTRYSEMRQVQYNSCLTTL
jgi:hypothetical protein